MTILNGFDKSAKNNNHCISPEMGSSGMLFDNLKCDHLLDKKQVADALNISIKTIDRWVCLGEIPFKKLGRLVRFSGREIESWLQQRSHYGN